MPITNVIKPDDIISGLSTTGSDVPVVLAHTSADGAPAGYDPRDVSGRIIRVTSDPDDPNGVNFSYSLLGSNDPQILAVIDKYRPLLENIPGNPKDHARLLQDFYREVGNVKSQSVSVTTTPPSAPTMTSKRPPTTVRLVTDDEDVQPVQPVQQTTERITEEAAVEQYPDQSRGVEFLMADGGRMLVNYSHVSIQGLNLVLVADTRNSTGVYRPPLSGDGRMVPVVMLIDGLVDESGSPQPVRAYMIHEPYRINDKLHMVLLIDRGEDDS